MRNSVEASIARPRATDSRPYKLGNIIKQKEK